MTTPLEGFDRALDAIDMKQWQKVAAQRDAAPVQRSEQPDQVGSAGSTRSSLHSEHRGSGG